VSVGNDEGVRMSGFAAPITPQGRRWLGWLFIAVLLTAVWLGALWLPSGGGPV